MIFFWYKFYRIHVRGLVWSDASLSLRLAMGRQCACKIILDHALTLVSGGEWSYRVPCPGDDQGRQLCATVRNSTPGGPSFLSFCIQISSGSNALESWSVIFRRRYWFPLLRTLGCAKSILGSLIKYQQNKAQRDWASDGGVFPNVRPVVYALCRV